MRAISKVIFVEMLLIVVMLLGLCVSALVENIDSDMMTKDAVCDGILVDNYYKPNIVSGIVNLDGLCATDKISNDNGRATTVTEAEL